MLTITVVNRIYQEMAAYYDTAIVPVRVCHRQDKSHAEGGVKFASTLKHHRFRKRPYIRLRFLQNYTTLKLIKYKQRYV